MKQKEWLGKRPAPRRLAVVRILSCLVSVGSSRSSTVPKYTVSTLGTHLPELFAQGTESSFNSALPRQPVFVDGDVTSARNSALRDVSWISLPF
ncbi:hypothetical protein B0T16DRAFT_75421 [Cercophora newfieldiana]|uniref:Secreted protein n=1 Tax=Cercophora newfieldiana TaxID=92897 RepID=A0AA39YGT9_9PEZI|nr:hypothetical protein B0T16DRAFT_75421 [Cercophora newfieldiana]